MKNIVFSLLAFLPCLQVNGQTPMVSVCNGDNQVLAWSSKDITAKMSTDDATTIVEYTDKKYSNGYRPCPDSNIKVINKNCLWGEVPSPEAAVNLGTTITKGGVTYNVLWAPWNLGGSSTSIDGLFFSYGEDGTKYAYDSEGKTIGFTTDCSSDGKDIANQWWGGDWQIPTAEMWQLLVARKTKTYTTGSGKNKKTVDAWDNNTSGWFSTFTQNEYYTISYMFDDGTVTGITLPCCGFYKGSKKVEDKNGSEAQAANYLSSTVEEKTGRVNALHAWSSVGVGDLRAFTLTISTVNTDNFLSADDYYLKNYGYSIRPVRLVPVSK